MTKHAIEQFRALFSGAKITQLSDLQHAGTFLLDQIEELQAEVEQLRDDAGMACITPADDCECAGCMYATQRNGQDQP